MFRFDQDVPDVGQVQNNRIRLLRLVLQTDDLREVSTGRTRGRQPVQERLDLFEIGDAAKSDSDRPASLVPHGIQIDFEFNFSPRAN